MINTNRANRGIAVVNVYFSRISFRLLLPILSMLMLAVSSASGQKMIPSLEWELVPIKGPVKPGTVVKVKVRTTVPQGHYTYSLNPKLAEIGPQPTVVAVGDKPAVSLQGRVSADRKPTRKYDEAFEDTVETFKSGELTLTVPVKISKTATGTVSGWITVTTQVCNEGNCSPPKDAKVDFTLDVALASADTAATKDTATNVAETGKDTAEATPTPTDTASNEVATADTAAPISPDVAAGQLGPKTADAETTPDNDKDKIKQAEEDGLMAYLGLAASAGALALLTPCVFPMIPITVSFFTKRPQTTRKRALRDAGLYSVGIISTFTLIGFLCALLLGASGIQDFATNPVINIIVAAVFLALALSLFGMFEIQLPTGVLNRLNRKAQGDGIGAVMLMGLVFSLTSFTCTVPFVGAVMTTATTTGSWAWPMMGMAVFATVFSAPFFFLALFPSLMKSLPKSGGWLNSVKVVMGFIEIAAAIKFISNADLVLTWGIFTRELFLAIWVAIAVLTTVYLLGRFQLPHDSPVEKVGPVRMLFAMGSLAVGFWLLTGLFGGRLGEIDAFIPPQEYPGKGNTGIFAGMQLSSPGGKGGASHEETWLTDKYEEALALAQKENKPVFIDFTGYTCTNCRWMEQNMFPKEEVAALMEKYVLVRLYTDGREPVHKKNQKMQIDRFETNALPYYVVMTPDGKVIDETSYTRNTEQFVQFLERGIDGGKLASN